MTCPSCNREVPMSFRCRACGADLRNRPVAASAGAGRARAARPSAGSAKNPPRPDDPVNPYASPEVGQHSLTGVGSDPQSQVLAGRGARLSAALLDGLAALVVLAPGLFLMFAGMPTARAQGLDAPAGSDMQMLLGVTVFGVALLVLAIYQLRLLAREGQTIGKRIMHIRIVNYDDGQTAGPGRTIWKRTILNGLLGNFIPLYGLIDPLFIFGAERRCLHDYIAGTKVVEAP